MKFSNLSEMTLLFHGDSYCLGESAHSISTTTFTRHIKHIATHTVVHLCDCCPFRLLLILFIYFIFSSSFVSYLSWDSSSPNPAVRATTYLWSTEGESWGLLWYKCGSCLEPCGCQATPTQCTTTFKPKRFNKFLLGTLYSILSLTLWPGNIPYTLTRNIFVQPQ